jgi:protein-S-isoprenylcysteine O-methyltransferase Ste14
MQTLEVLLLHTFFLIDVFIRPPGEGVDRESQRQAILGKILMLSLLYLPLLNMEISARKPWVAALGIGLTIVGAIVGLWGRASLGRMGTPKVVLIEEPSLYTKGLYRFIRHPIYAGFSLAFLGHQVTFLSIYGLAVWVLFLVTFLRKRMQVEEEMLIEQFQDVYIDYGRSTWKIFPYLY